jgi:hypothetical protein
MSRVCFATRQLISDTEVVGNLLVLLLWLRQRDSDGIVAAIIHDTGNKNDDKSALRSYFVVSTRHLQSLRNHTEMMVFVTIQTSSDTEVVGDLLWTVWANQYGDEIPQHISMTSKSVLILYVHTGLSIVDHTVIIPAPLQTVASRNCHGFCDRLWKVVDFIRLNGARRRI